MSKLTTASNSNNPIVRNLTQSRKDVDSASKKTTNPETKYENFSKLGALSNLYNNSQTRLVQVEQFDKNTITTTTSLKDKEQVIRNLQKLIQEHQNTKIRNEVPKVFTVTQIADKYLEQAKNILNTTNGNGSYILGGIKSNIAPCQVDLTKTSNVDKDNKITSSYTQSIASAQSVKVSNGHNVVTGDLAADNPAIQKMIAGFNLDKGGKAAEANKNLNEAKKELEALLAKNLDQQKTLEKAKERNNSDQEHYTSILCDNFMTDPITSFTDLKNCQQAYMLEMTVLQNVIRSDQQLFSILAG